MKFSEGWLREFCEAPADIAALAEQLTMQGLEVDATERVAPSLGPVVVGRVVEVAPHPDADRLKVCRVDVGDATLTIVCGAPDVRAGGVYPVARIGATLPGGLDIRAARLRGVASEGMLCSAVELGLAESSDGLLELDGGAEPGQPLAELLQLDEHVIDLNITPNRADCFSVAGVARDLAAATAAEFRPPPVNAVPATCDDTFPAATVEGSGCPRLGTRVVRDVDPQARTPLWMRERLRRAGVRPISAVVDVTNYVMLELGQPLHAYDLERLHDRLVARRATAGETLRLLGGEEVQVDESVLVIADGRGPVGLAGIMGGEATGVGASTRHVLLESAAFEPGVIAGRARRYGLQTDASMRFERGVDPTLQERALERATRLLTDIAGGRPGPVCVAGETFGGRPEVRLRRERLAALLGVGVPDGEVASLLRRLGIEVRGDDQGWVLRAPPFRFDLAVEVDYIEEVARLHGYGNVPAKRGQQPAKLGHIPEASVEPRRAALALVERGWHEAVTYSFTDPDLDTRLAGGRTGMTLLNPISADLSVLRQSLWPGLLMAAGRNLARQQRRVRLFEIGVRFTVEDDETKEINTVSGVAAGPRWPEQWGETESATDFYDLKADLEALFALTGEPEAFAFVAAEHPALRPGRSARIERAGACVGWAGELHPAAVSALDLPQPPLLFELDAEAVLRAVRPAWTPVPRVPSVRRDLAILVDADLPVGRMLAAIRAVAGDTLRELLVFDVYAGPGIDAGQKSVALGLILQETSRTLTDADVEKLLASVVTRLASDFRARIRE